MSKRSRYITRLFDAVSRASGDGVRWVLQVTGAEIVDSPVEITLTRIADGITTHIFGDFHLGDLRDDRSFPYYGTLSAGRILMRMDMALRRSKVQTRPCGDVKRERVMNCIRDYNARLGRSPSHAEIARAVGSDPKTVSWHLNVLSQQGRIEIIHGKSYGIILKEEHI